METLSPHATSNIVEANFSDTEMNPEYEPVNYASAGGPSSTLWSAMNHDQETGMASELSVPDVPTGVIGGPDEDMEYEEVPQDEPAEVLDAHIADAEEHTDEIEVMKSEPSEVVSQLPHTEEGDNVAEGLETGEQPDVEECNKIAEEIGNQGDGATELEEHKTAGVAAYEDGSAPDSAQAVTESVEAGEKMASAEPSPHEVSKEPIAESDGVPGASSEVLTDPSEVLRGEISASSEVTGEDLAAEPPSSSDGPIQESASLRIARQTEESSAAAGNDVKESEESSKLRVDERDEMQIEPVQLTFHDQAFVLFSENGESSTYTAWDEQVGAISDVSAPRLAIDNEIFWETLDGLFEALRVKEALGEFLGEDVGVDSELIMHFPDLELRLGEDNVFAREISCSDLLRLHQGLGLKHSLRIEVSEDVRFISQYNLLAQQVADAGLSTGEVSELAIPAEDPQMPAQALGQSAVGADVETADSAQLADDKEPKSTREVRESSAAAEATEREGFTTSSSNDEATAQTPNSVDAATAREPGTSAASVAPSPQEEDSQRKGASATNQGLGGSESEPSLKQAQDQEEIVEYDESSSASVSGEVEAGYQEASEELGEDVLDYNGGEDSAVISATEVPPPIEVSAENYESVEDGEEWQGETEEASDEQSDETVRAKDSAEPSNSLPTGDSTYGETEGDPADDETEDAYAAYEDGQEREEGHEILERASDNASQASHTKRSYEDASESEYNEETSADAKKSRIS